MTWWVVLLVALAIVGAFLVLPRLAKAYTRSSILDDCARLEAELVQMRLRDADLEAVAAKQAELDNCNASALAAGAPIDLGAQLLRSCANNQRQIDEIFGSFRSTDYSDFVTRNNKRNDLLRAGDQLVRCYRDAIVQASSLTTLQQIRNAIARSLESSEVREHCFGDRAGGCDRINDTSEPEGMSKVRDEWNRIRDPLRVALSEVDARIATMQAAQAAAARSAARSPAGVNALGGGPMPFLRFA